MGQMESKVGVFADVRNNDLSITTIDDVTNNEVETTLSVTEAWKLVTELNVAIQKLRPDVIKTLHKTKRGKDAVHNKYVFNDTNNVKDIPAQYAMRGSRIKDAVLEAIGSFKYDPSQAD